MPATVQAVLAARIDRLPPEEKRLLQTAAVIGMEVPLPLLQAIAELPEEALHHGLAHLQAAEFLYETRLFPEPEYTFKHALTHEVAYRSLLQERRRALHARMSRPWKGSPATAWRTRSSAWRPCRAGRCGRRPALLSAGRGQGLGALGVREAVTYLSSPGGPRAPPRGPTHGELAIDLRLDLRRALTLGAFARILDYLRRRGTRALGWTIPAAPGTDLPPSDGPCTRQRVTTTRHGGEPAALALAARLDDVSCMHTQPSHWGRIVQWWRLSAGSGFCSRA